MENHFSHFSRLKVHYYCITLLKKWNYVILVINKLIYYTSMYNGQASVDSYEI